MGGHDYDSHSVKSLTRKQKKRINEIESNESRSYWYYEVDRKTGVKKKRRRRIIIKHKK